MRAMVLHAIGNLLKLEEVAKPTLQTGCLLIKVSVCGICRTDLHVVDGDLKEPNLPIIPGHQIIGHIEKIAEDVTGFHVGQRVGVPWLGGSCGHCFYCDNEQENLCDNARYTGYQVNGGFAEFCSADARYCFPIPNSYSDSQAAPLLCAGLIGYRSYRPAKGAQRIGLYGFGAAAHILIQVARYNGQEVYAFTRLGDIEAQTFAKRLGAVWAGDSSQQPPQDIN